MGGNADYTSIQDAVSAASSGDTILVSPGTYTENVVVDKQLIITSTAGSLSTSVVAASVNDHVFSVISDGVTIEGFTITGATDIGKAGVYLKSDSSTISNNEVFDNRYNIYLDTSKLCVIDRNLVESSTYCIYLLNSSENTVSNNLADEAEYSDYGIYLENSNDNSLLNNSIPPLRNGGIYLSSSSNNVIEGNTIPYTDEGSGIFLSSSSYNTLTQNTAYGTMSGISLFFSDDNTLNGNTASGDNSGISLDSSDNNTLTGNTVKDCSFTGVYIGASVQNALTGNTVSDCGDYGILLYNSGNNEIFNNYFDNQVNVGFDGNNTGNKWNTEKEAAENIIGGSYLGGNYWATPDGTGFSQNGGDSDGDGISDSEYVLDNDNIDYLPLVDSEASVPPVNNSTAPVLINVTPSSGSEFAAGTTNMEIRFNYSDAQNDINTSSIIFTFDSIDVTDDYNATIAESYASYNASGLAAGSHSASVVVADNEGNSVTFSTSFTISSSSGSSSSSSSSGGGGGGGGTTGEKYENVAVKEVESIFVIKDAHVTYEFSEEGNAISSVQFDSLKNSGTIQAIVEVLKDRSSFADIDAPGNIYQQMNIWVGKVGFVSPENVENLLITYRVEKAWLTENNIKAENVLLYRYADASWNVLPTSITEDDDQYVYYESETTGFSPFAISSEYEVVEEEELRSVEDQGTRDSQDTWDDPEASAGSSGALGSLLVLGGVSVLLIGAYMMYRKRS